MDNIARSISELYEQALHQFLFEMNVANLNDLRTRFAAMFNAVLHTRNANLPQPLQDFFMKRAIKAMQNDDAGNMVTRMALQQTPADAEPWLVTALQNGELVYQLEFKNGFEDRLAHVVDWIVADATAERVIRATPEHDFLGLLAHHADEFFARQQAQKRAAEPEGREQGSEVIMTFRTDPSSKQTVAYNENDTADDKARGPVVAFWVKLTSPEALDREGRLMGHCVGSYAASVASEDVVIYSLRDARNKPHATVELNQRSQRPTINQVKGKGNAAPIGTYAPYVRDFLNGLGVNASGSGRTDLRGLGLLNHKGKFGTIADVGGDILITFRNGDTMRTLSEEPEDHWSKPEPQTWYVEREGSVPMYFHNSEQYVQDVKMLRTEVSRYPVYAANLITFFTDTQKTTYDNDMLAQIDVFYDPAKNKWGHSKDLMEVILSHKGVKISRLAEKLYLAHGETTFAIAELDYVRRRNVDQKASGKSGIRINGIQEVEIINDIPAVKLLPEVISAFADKFLDPSSFSLMSDKAKETLLGAGLTRRTKEGYRPVPEDKTIYQSKTGSVRVAANRLFFYKSQRLLGSAYIGQMGQLKFVNGIGNVPFYKIGYKQLNFLSRDDRQQAFQLISELTTRKDMHVIVDDFDVHEAHRETSDLGFAQKNNKLVPLSDVSFNKRLPGGYVVRSETTAYASRYVTLEKGEKMLLTLHINVDDDTIKQLEVAENVVLADLRVPLAAMINLTKLKFKRHKMLAWFLQERHGKIYPQTDTQLIKLYSTNQLSLGQNLYFHLRDYQTSYGEIEARKPDDRHGRTLVYIRWTDKDHHRELNYQMVQRPESDATRSAIINAAAKFMRFFHAKIEPFLSDQLVGTDA